MLRFSEKPLLGRLNELYREPVASPGRLRSTRLSEFLNLSRWKTTRSKWDLTFPFCNAINQAGHAVHVVKCSLQWRSSHTDLATAQCDQYLVARVPEAIGCNRLFIPNRLQKITKFCANIVGNVGIC